MRINRNTRRSARPVFRSVNSNRRRAKMYGNTVNSARRRNINCSTNSNVVYYADLNKAQKDYVLANWEKWSEMEWLWGIFYENEADTPDAKPERAWVDDMLDGLSYDDIATFEIVDDKTAVPEKKAPDDFNTYINYLNSSRRRNGRRALNSARSLELLTFNELNDAQKDYVVNNALRSSLGETIWAWFNDDVYDAYKTEVRMLAADYEDKIREEAGIDFKIDADKLYWQSNSQGPYPEWDLGEVFDSVTTYEGEIYFSGCSLDVERCMYDELTSDDDVDAQNFYQLKMFLAETLQEFIDEVWTEIDHVCQAYPDEGWIYDMLSANDYGDFIAVDETEAKPVRV